jgi:hypothetical protein
MTTARNPLRLEFVIVFMISVSSLHLPLLTERLVLVVTVCLLLPGLFGDSFHLQPVFSKACASNRFQLKSK